MTTLVFMRHIRQAKFCRGGMIEWFNSHGIDYRRLVKEGIPAEELEATGDKVAFDVTEIARLEVTSGSE